MERPFPEVPVTSFREALKLVGPGIILASLDVGSGELIFCSRMGALYGGALAWTILLGALLKYWPIETMARYTLLTGKGSNEALADIHKAFLIPFGVGFLCLALFNTPGMISSAGTALTAITGVADYRIWGLVTYILMMLVWFGPKVSYVAIEKLCTATTIIITVGTIFATSLVTTPDVVVDILTGLFKFGIIPEGADPAFTLSCIATGFGGITAAMTYPYFVQSKGYGMAHYKAKISRGSSEKEGTVGEIKPKTTPEEVSKYKKWLKMLRYDLLYVSWPLQIMGALMYVWAGAAILRPRGLAPGGFQTVVAQGEIFGYLFGFGGFAFYLFLAWLSLFDTSASVQDAYARYFADWVPTLFPKFRGKESKIYYGFLILEIIVGLFMTFSGISPFALLIIGTCTGYWVLALAPYFAYYLMTRRVPKEYSLSTGWKIILAIAAVVLTFFGLWLTLKKLGIKII